MVPSPFFRPQSAASGLATRLTLTRRGQAAVLACALGLALGPLPALVTGCGQGAAPSTACPGDSALAASSAAPLVVSEAPACSCASPSPETSASAAASAPAPTDKVACPEDMALVEGDYCPDVEQRCLEHGKEGKSAED